MAGGGIMDTTFGRLELVLHERPPRAARRKAEHSRERAPPASAVVVEGCSLSIVAVCFSPFKDLLVRLLLDSYHQAPHL